MQLGRPTAGDIFNQLLRADEDRSTVLIIAVSVMMVFPTMSIILRLFAKRRTNSRISADDYAILAALFLAFGLHAITTTATRFGVGRHAAVVGRDNIRRQFMTQYAFVIVYIIDITLVKGSILLFYRRLFDTRQFKRTSAIVAGIILAYCTAFVLVSIFQCTPIPHMWDKSIEGHCINTPIFLLLGAVFNIVSDIVIVLLPLPIVWNLQVTRRQKIALTSVFLLGGFVCVASIVRVPYLWMLTTSGDPTWYSVNAAIWTMVEVDLGIVCACLPVMRPLFVGLVSDTRRRTIKLTRSTIRSSRTVTVTSYPARPGTNGQANQDAGNPYINLVSPDLEAGNPYNNIIRPDPVAVNPYAGPVAPGPAPAGVTWTTVTSEGHDEEEEEPRPRPRRFPWVK
ncbi:MAG: hypothetical protein M1823_001315 [Watsoniomyces obsoletus]|nr:MAG: hypothetical protein M1823_001315 [Watsoniomyces obsoletus]